MYKPRGMGAEFSPLVVAVLSAIAAWSGVWQDLSDLAIARVLSRPVPALSRLAPTITVGAIRDVGTESHPIVSFDAVAVRGVTLGQAWEWRLGEVIFSLDPNDTSRIAATLPAPQQFFADGPLGKSTVSLWARNLAADIRLTADGRVEAVALRGETVTVIAPDMTFEAARLEFSLRVRSDGTMALEAAVDEVLMPEPYRLPPPIGDTADSVRLSAWATGLARVPPTTAEAWKDANGVVEISELSLRWGPFHLALDGRFDLDRLLRPAGRFSVTAAGLTAAIASAHQAGVLSDDAHGRARDALDQVGELRGSETADDLRLSFAMSGGYLNWLGLPIARLPRFGVVTPDGDCEFEAGETTTTTC